MGEKGIPEVGLCQTLSPSAQAPVLCLHHCTVQWLQHFKGLRDSVVLG